MLLSINQSSHKSALLRSDHDFPERLQSDTPISHEYADDRMFGLAATLNRLIVKVLWMIGVGKEEPALGKQPRVLHHKGDDKNAPDTFALSPNDVTQVEQGRK